MKQKTQYMIVAGVSNKADLSHLLALFSSFQTVKEYALQRRSRPISPGWTDIGFADKSTGKGSLAPKILEAECENHRPYLGRKAGPGRAGYPHLPRCMHRVPVLGSADQSQS